MGTLTFMHDTIDGTERLIESLVIELHQGNFAQAKDRAECLVRLLDGQQQACCLECGMPLSSDEIDRYTSWCANDAPSLALRFEI